MKYFVIVAFVLIIGSLASALFFMMRGGKQRSSPDDPDIEPNGLPNSLPTSLSNSQDDQRKSNHMFRALALRVGFSIFLFVCILVAWKLGYIQPTGIPAGA